MIQTVLRIIMIAPVSIRILRAHCSGQGTRRVQQLTPGVVSVLHDYIPARVVQPNDVPLAVVQVVVLRAVRLVRNPTVSVGPFSSISFYNTSALLALLSEQYRP